jgi:hypothetical protein
MRQMIAIFFSSGRWIIVLVAAISIGLVIKKIVIPLLNGEVRPIVGDGVHVSSYEFPLSPCLVNRKLLIASGNYKDALSALDAPRVIRPRQVAKINAGLADSGGYIQGPDRVIGVVIHGKARAYPIPIMNWHSVINDRLGGKPILVYWDAFSSCAMVFSRQTGGKVRQFGYSGLVYNGTLLIYNRKRKQSQESLWCPMLCRAITGPAAARKLTLKPLPCAIVTWHKWKSMFPKTTMIEGIPRLFPAYRKDVYHSYDHDPTDFHYRVTPMWKRPSPPAKAQIIVLRIKHHWYPLTIAKLVSIKNIAGVVHIKVGGENVVIQCWQDLALKTASVIAPAKIPTAYSFLYVWYGQHPREFNTPLWRALAR